MTESPKPSFPVSNSEERDNRSRSDLYAVLFTMAFPTLVTLVYFEWLKDAESGFQQIAFGAGKALQFGFPLAWVWMWHRSKLCSCFESVADGEPVKLEADAGGELGTRIGFPADRWSENTLRQMVIGVGFGILVVASMFSVYFFLIASTETGEGLTGLVREKVSGMEIDSFGKYLTLGIFYTLIHSFMEEYYWRWFVFDFLRKFVSVLWANVLSSLGFMAHHVVLLGFFFGWDSPLTYLFSASIAVGGAFWAWQYRSTRNLAASWVSHMVVDAGIFSLGYFLVRSML